MIRKRKRVGNGCDTGLSWADTSTEAAKRDSFVTSGASMVSFDGMFAFGGNR